ncbi:hypothetical protein HZA87_02315 [Candidatus Uhrbacteria bacterium]|nr:hypothetical protein [Candidatus Uhrbacteria bacterium]
MGKYATQTVARQDQTWWLVKRMEVVGKQAVSQAMMRAEAVREYVRQLQKAGVHVPFMQITTEGSQILIRSQIVGTNKTPAHTEELSDNVFVALSKRGDDPEFVREVTRCVLIEVLRVLATLTTHHPIGYDTGLDNFVFDPDRKIAWAVDVYPPRLGYHIPDGTIIPVEDRLINYPELRGEQLDVEKERQMRRYYYTKRGTLTHLLGWFIGSVFSRNNRCPKLDEIQSHASVQAIWGAFEEILSINMLQDDYDWLREDPDTHQYLHDRLQRCWNLEHT